MCDWSYTSSPSPHGIITIMKVSLWVWIVTALLSFTLIFTVRWLVSELRNSRPARRLEKRFKRVARLEAKVRELEQLVWG